MADVLGDARLPPADGVGEGGPHVGVLLPGGDRLGRPVPFALGGRIDHPGVQADQVAGDLIGLAWRHPVLADAVGIVAVDLAARSGVVDLHAGADAAEAPVDGLLQRILVETGVVARPFERQLDLAARAAGRQRGEERDAKGGSEETAHAAFFTPFCSSSNTTVGA